MGRARYVLAIAVGLAVGMAVGWYSGRVNEAQPQAAGQHHRHHRGSQSVNVHPPRHTPDRSAPEPQTRVGPPTMRQLQQQMLQCLYNHPLPEQQAACLQEVLQRQLDAVRDRWGTQGGGIPWLPFAALTQD